MRLSAASGGSWRLPAYDQAFPLGESPEIGKNWKIQTGIASQHVA
jgi:hypothetical protein